MPRSTRKTVFVLCCMGCCLWAAAGFAETPGKVGETTDTPASAETKPEDGAGEAKGNPPPADPREGSPEQDAPTPATGIQDTPPPAAVGPAGPPPEFRGPDVTLIAGEERTVHEYRHNGQLRMIKVVPKRGKPYYLVPRDPTRGWGDLEQAEALHAEWVLWEF